MAEGSPSELRALAGSLAQTLRAQRRLGVFGMPAGLARRLLRAYEAALSVDDDLQAERADAARRATRAAVESAARARAAGPARGAEVSADLAAVGPGSGSPPSAERSGPSSPPPAQVDGVRPPWAPRSTDVVKGVGSEVLRAIRDDLGDCRRCKLSERRANIVFGVGNPRARLMFIGEGPGADEDRLAEPFVGKAGRLLTRMIGAMGLAREDVYIANVVKCRPPANRDPRPEEVAMCRPFLNRQIAAVEPEVIVTLGRVAPIALFDRAVTITRERGTWLEYQGVPLMLTFHPAYLLRTPAAKREAWADLQEVMRRLQLPTPQRH